MAFNIDAGRGRVRPVMNVTPLVDVVLVLLIIFMVVAPLLVKQFHLLVPPQEQKDTPPKTADDTQIVVYLEADGTVSLNGAVLPRAELPEKLRRVFASRTDDVVFFDANDAASYADAASIMDLCRGAGALTVGVITKN